MNVYGRAKAEGERLMTDGRASGLSCAVARFSNVYGSVFDYHDRVVPALARAAAAGGLIGVDGYETACDFTHVGDVAEGVLRLVDALSVGEAGLPPIHFVSGTATTLAELAALAQEFAMGGAVAVEERPARGYDVARFCGDPSRAAAILGWHASTGIREGFRELVRDISGALKADGRGAG
jgi:nucleoside-diphosphate-sugar epimerase